LSKKVSGNFAVITVSTLFSNMFLATNLRKGIDNDIKVIC